MANDTLDNGKFLLDQEEAALAAKRTAVKAAASSLDTLRKAGDDCRTAFANLRECGFTHRDIVQAYSLTKDEAAAILPRRPRKGSSSDGSDSAHEPGQPVQERV